MPKPPLKILCPACKGALIVLPPMQDLMNIMRTKVFYECATCRRIWEPNAMVKSGFKYVARTQATMLINTTYVVADKKIYNGRTLLSYAANPTALPLIQQFELKWDVIAAWMKDARKYAEFVRYRNTNAHREKDRCYLLINRGLYEQFKIFGTCGTRCIIIRDPNTKPVNNEQPFGSPSAAMDLRFGPMQYLAIKYPANEMVITTLPYAAITQFFPNLNPWSEYFPHMNLDDITATFAAIEKAAVKLPTLNFDENIEE